MYRLKIKRLLDALFSGLGLAVLSPLFLAIMLLVKLDSPGPVFFRQQRFGAGKKKFGILKFRTMRIDAPSNVPTHLLANPRAYITRSGVFLRRTSLDELPQLVNILRGEMSIIGPRPVLEESLIEERDKYVSSKGLTPNDVTPGLTGWAQINGRDVLEDADKARLDGEYVEQLSFRFDCRCFFMTFIKVLSSDGVVEGGGMDDGGNR